MHDCERCVVGKSITSDRLCPRCREFIDMRTNRELQTKQATTLAEAIMELHALLEHNGRYGINANVLFIAREIIAARAAEITPDQPPQSWYDEDTSGLQGGKSDE